MNIHHLELFYYVAKHGGIASAVRNIPYGIQQPAVSGQMAKLEESLGVKLFERRPFSLTPEGEELFRFVAPFFSNVGAVAKKIRGKATPQLRIAAPTLVLHEYVPELLNRLRGKFPAFRLNIHEATQLETESLLQAQEIDLAVTNIEKKQRPGFHAEELAKLPLVLLVAKDHPLCDAKELWGRDTIKENLITFPPDDPVPSHFQAGLKSLGVEWFAGIEVNSIALIECYVANGFGIGLAATFPGMRHNPGVRCVPLNGFEPVTMGVVWTGKLSPIGHQFLDEVRAFTKKM